MICPRAGCGAKTRVLWTRQEDGNVVRRRVCPGCGHSFTTAEKISVRGWVQAEHLSEWPRAAI